MARPDMVLREHWRALVGPVMVLFVVVGVASYLASIAPDRDGRNWPRIAVVVLAAGIIARWTVVPWLGWLTDRHVVVGGRLVEQRGLWTQEGRAIALVRVADVRVTQASFVDRMLGMGNLVVVPADGREAVELVGLPQVKRVQARLLRLVDLARDAAYHSARQSAPPSLAQTMRQPVGKPAEQPPQQTTQQLSTRQTLRIDRPPGTLPAEPRGESEGPVG
ncbi:PH domain-containing protein [Yinghuangia sp. YIM S10712]|uniref:PH domain-containing protein n=1 Tax=Yinghuangia sp. YIM S10712 TaxID=3436930 RepID=UPI003F53258B